MAGSGSANVKPIRGSIKIESARQTIALPKPYLACLFGVALILNGLVGGLLGYKRPLESDGAHFLAIAQSLARGQGYRQPLSYWPQEPTAKRLPAWPFVLSMALRAAPSLDPHLMTRLINGLIHGGGAVLMALLVFDLTRRRRGALLGGLVYAAHPTGLFCVQNGLSEPLFLLLCIAGIRIFLGRGPRSRLLGGGLLGLACLVRANFVLWMAVAVVLALVIVLKQRWARPKRWIPQAVLWAGVVVVFYLPLSFWVMRNYLVVGHFPLISTLKGQTFYGGNNRLVATNFTWWGYWVFPDRIAGETPMRELARTRSEYETDQYYLQKGQAFVHTQALLLPQLGLGKLVRAYVPIPWKPAWGSYLVGIYRLALYLGVGLAARRVKGLPQSYLMILAALLITNVVTVLLFWGHARFAFAVEPFLIPLIVAGLPGHKANGVNP